jgi:hypothetical protein
MLVLLHRGGACGVGTRVGRRLEHCALMLSNDVYNDVTWVALEPCGSIRACLHGEVESG